MTQGSGLPVLPDVLGRGLAIVFCGTAPARASARARAYYAGPGNRFWPTLHEIGLTPRRYAPADFPRLLEHALGLTDLAKFAVGVDRELSAADFDAGALREKIAACQPRWLAFTSKRAAEVYLARKAAYGVQPECLGPTQIFVLPSPSGAARAAWDIAPWRELVLLSGASRAR